MKSYLLIFGLFLNVFSHSQMVYEWINTQYNPSDATEDSFVDYLVLNEGVKSFHEKQELIAASKEVSIVHIEVELQRNGYVKQVQKVLPDGSESISEFTYVGSSGAYKQHWVSIFNGGAKKDTIREDIYTGDQKDWQIRADSLAFDSKGNIIYFRNNRDEVYSTFDKHGRKVKDSIPAHPKLMAHEISYKYGKKRIVKVTSYLDQNIKIKTVYKVDKRGNWTKCTIKSNGNIKNAVLRRKLFYFD